MTVDFQLKSKVAVVLGGTGAFGSMICHALAEAGASVVVVATNEIGVKALANDLSGYGVSTLGIVANVLEPDTLERAAATIIGEFQRLDLLVNAVGGSNAQAATNPARPFFDLPVDTLHQVLDLNLMGAIHAAQVFGRVMARQGEGVILNISALAAERPVTRTVAYGAAKAGLENFTRWLAAHLALEYSPQIRVNAIAPGFFITHENSDWLINPETEELTTRGQQIIDHTPMKRFGEPEDLLGTVLWLLSDASRFVTGIVVPVDGGFSAYSGV